jgi:hypothetical protein
MKRRLKPGRTANEREMKRLVGEFDDMQNHLRYLINPYLGGSKRIPSKIGDYIHLCLNSMRGDINSLGDGIGYDPKKRKAALDRRAGAKVNAAH